MLIKGSLLQANRNRRDRIAIFSAILACTIEGNKKTKIMYTAGLSTAQLHRHMETLMRSELLEMLRHKKAVVYKTTAKGRHFLEEFDSLVRLLS